ncbi:MAG: Protoheme IX farnesyltransferase [Anaerolineales bacterium]|nr:Protoheme IX farnesyltransferase [Anaerolineales bacterium]
MTTARQLLGVSEEHTTTRSWHRSIANYVALTKPFIIVLLLVTTIGAMFIAQRGVPALDLLFYTLVGGALAAGGSGALNSYADRDIDQVMSRTSRRPVPENRVPPRGALIFGLTLSTLSVVVFYVLVNPLSALLTLIGIVYYAGIYTLVLKRLNHHNIVIGGAAGALPPLIGWAAVTNRIDLLGLYLFAIIFYWTPPHTWALTLLVRKDYERAHVPMLPVVRGDAETRRQIVLYSLILVPITLLPFVTRTVGFLYLGSAALLGGWLLVLAVRLLQDATKHSARRLYKFSSLYLALIFLAMVLDRVGIIPPLK